MTRSLPLLTCIETANKNVDQQYIREIQIVISVVKNIKQAHELECGWERHYCQKTVREGILGEEALC